MRTINEIVVHCTATKEGKDFHVEDVRKWHKAKGWKDLGYHYLVNLDGGIEVGRPIDQQGAHVTGHNATTIGIVYVGGLDADGKPKDTRNYSQKEALEDLIASLLIVFPSIKKISGHRDYAAKACPCFDAKKDYAELLRKK